MAKRMLFIGAGAIGSYLGAFLARPGTRSPWWIRAEQVETLGRQGIAVTAPTTPSRPSRRDPRARAAAARSDFDIGFIAIRPTTPRGPPGWPCRILKPEGYLVSTQNCWNDPIVAGIAGAERSVGLIMSKIGVALWKPRQVSAAWKRARRRARRVPRGRARRAHHRAGHRAGRTS